MNSHNQTRILSTLLDEILKERFNCLEKRFSREESEISALEVHMDGIKSN